MLGQACELLPGKSPGTKKCERQKSRRSRKVTAASRYSSFLDLTPRRRGCERSSYKCQLCGRYRPLRKHMHSTGRPAPPVIQVRSIAVTWLYGTRDALPTFRRTIGVGTDGSQKKQRPDLVRAPFSGNEWAPSCRLAASRCARAWTYPRRPTTQSRCGRRWPASTV